MEEKKEGDLLRKEIKEIVARGEHFLEKALERACEEGRKDLVEELIEKGAENWNTGMCGAARRGKGEIVVEMIRRGANDFERGLKEAGKSGKIEVVDIFLEKGARDYHQVLLEACKRGDEKMVCDLEKKVKLSCNAHDFSIAGAAYKGDKELMEKMLKKRLTKYNSFTNWSFAFTYACEGGNKEMVAYILKKGVKREYKEMGVYNALRNGHEEVYSFLTGRRMSLYQDFGTICSK